MIRQFDRLSRELRRRVLLMVGRAVLAVVNDSTPLQTVQVEALPGEIIDGAEKFGMYGITSHPLPGADALVLSVGGIRQHPVILIDDRRHRVKELAEGEVCIYTAEDESGNMHRIILKDGREIEMHCGSSSLVLSPSGVTVRGDFAASGGGFTHEGNNVGGMHMHNYTRPVHSSGSGPTSGPS